MFGLIFFAFFSLFPKEPDYKYISNDIIKKFSVEILEPKQLRICALGGSSDKGIKMIHIGVCDRGPGNVDDARKLIVSLVLELVNRYNSNTEIRSYLINYPFTDSNFVFDISYVNLKGGYLVRREGIDSKQQIVLVSSSEGEISYCINPKKEMCPLEIVHTESFADAVKLVQEVN